MRARVAAAWRIRWLRLALTVVFAAGCAAAVAATDEAVTSSGIIGLRLGGDRDETRIVIDLDRAVSGNVESGEAPSRALSLSLPGVGAPRPMTGPGRGLVRSWTLESDAVGGRLAVRLTAPGEIRRRFLLPPDDSVDHYRYVVDIDPAGAGPSAVASAAGAAVQGPHTAAPGPVTAASGRETAPLAAPPAHHGRKVVVIDAGHGGRDFGASSATHQEKDLTLEAARTLAARLERGGHYKVVLTRDSDVYVPLEERVQIARRAGADLFISLHADSAGDDVGTHGASVYTLSDQAGGRVAAVLDHHEWFVRAAAREGDPAVGEILLDLTQRSTRNRSAVFAQMLVDHIGDRVDMLPRSRRDAGYFVLLAPDVPAVLLEMGFITSPVDEARLTDPAQRRRLMDGVAQAIDGYFAGQARLASR